MLKSKRTSFALTLLATSTVLAVMGVISGAQWLDLARLLATTLLVSHTVSHAVEFAARRAQEREPAPQDLPVARVVPPA